jgi:hypothetical protein
MGMTFWVELRIPYSRRTTRDFHFSSELQKNAAPVT